MVFRGKMADVTDATRNLLVCLRAAGCLHSSGFRSQVLRGSPSYTGLGRQLYCALLFLRDEGAHPPRLWYHIDLLPVSLDTRWLCMMSGPGCFLGRDSHSRGPAASVRACAVRVSLAPDCARINASTGLWLCCF